MNNIVALALSSVLSWLHPDVSVCRSILAIFAIVVFAGSLAAQLTPKQQADNRESFEIVWRTVRDRHPDPGLNGLDWPGIHDYYKPRIEEAQSMAAVRRTMDEMLHRLGSSHYAIIPSDVYNPIGSAAPAGQDHSNQPDAGSGIVPIIIDNKAVVGSVTPDSPAARAGIKPGMVIDGINGASVAPMLKLYEDARDPESQRIIEQSVSRKMQGSSDQNLALDVVDDQGRPKHLNLDRMQPKGNPVRFANLPETRVWFESRTLPGGAGYIRFNEFLDPASIMPRFEAALKSFAKAPGIILDLRGNPGGIGIMAMGIAGFFIDQDGLKLGEMKMRDTTLKFVIFPRPETWNGKLAILVDEGSASTTEILAGGLQDLGRARIFGVRTAGAALPSDIIRLPNGDGFQYAQASYISVNGKTLEGQGVTPDVIVRQTREALLAGRDLVIEAADQWIHSSGRP
jgi:carboxyl-terminal processing protease